MEKTRKVCDAHVHLGRSEFIYHTLHDTEIESFIKKFQIQHLLLMPFELDVEESNRKIHQLSKLYHEIHGLYWMQKQRIENDLKELKNFLGDGVVGVKFHGTYENLPISDKVYSPILEFLNDKEGILLVHTGRYKDGDITSNTSYQHVVNVAKLYPKIKVIMGHMGGNDTSIVKNALNASKNLKNIWFETSGITTPYRVERGVDVIGPERILFGSDSPWCSFRSMYYGVEDSLLDEKIKELIFYKNFLKLLKIN